MRGGQGARPRLDGGQAVRDDEDGAPLHQAVDGQLHRALAHAVQRARGLVQDQDGRVLRVAGAAAAGRACLYASTLAR